MSYEMCILISLVCNFKMLKAKYYQCPKFYSDFPEKGKASKRQYITLFLNAKEEKLSILTTKNRLIPLPVSLI